MKQLVKSNVDGKISVIEVPDPELSAGFVLVKNIYSAISLGTERSSIRIAEKSLLAKAKERPEDFKKVVNLMKKTGIKNAYQQAMNNLEIPGALGYSSVGEIIKISQGVKNLNVGDIVACGGVNYASHSEVIRVPTQLCCKVSPNTSLKEASLTTIASIALQGVRQSNPSLGDYTVVIGLGIVGMIAVQLLKLNGCRVIGIDIDHNKINFAKKEYGVKCYSFDKPSLINIVKSFTDGNGADKVIISASSDKKSIISLVPKIIRDRGEITVLGNVNLDLDRNDFYNKELNLNLSRSYGPGRYDSHYEEKGIDYPIGYIRWSEKRNMEMILDYLNNNKLSFANLITNTHKFESAELVYKKLSENKSFSLGEIFEYNNKISRFHDKEVPKNKKLIKSSKCNLGLIGAGSYAKSMLIPNFKKHFNLHSVCTSSGNTSKYIAEKFKFYKYSTRCKSLLEDSDLEVVAIATRHNLHSNQVIESLEKHKHVYVEKPLALKLEEIQKIRNAYASSEGSLMIGFNRRFSPHIEKLISFLLPYKSPFAINYRINSGRLSLDHWSQDEDIGGGRIIGEVCHFIDLCNYICSSTPDNTKIFFLDSESKDSCSINVKYPNGSVANISYFSNGDSSLGKERLEVFRDNASVVIDDFKTSFFHTNDKQKKFVTNREDKGQEAMIAKYAQGLKIGKVPIGIDEILDVSELIIKLNS